MAGMGRRSGVVSGLQKCVLHDVSRDGGGRIVLIELFFENLATNLCIRMGDTRGRCKSWLMEVLTTAPKAKPNAAKVTATPGPLSCPLKIYPLPKNASALEQAVAESLSQQKTERAAAREHD